MKSIVFIDSEINYKSKEIMDLWAVGDDNGKFHMADKTGFSSFVNNYDFICGHNIIHHDLKYVGQLIKENKVVIDTLYLSPLLFPRKPYHRLLKDDKLDTEDVNNPLNDSIKAKDLFYDELSAFNILPRQTKLVYCALLYEKEEFQGFFRYLGYKPLTLTDEMIKAAFSGKICENSPIRQIMEKYPVELAYALAIIGCDDRESITPPWVLKNYPRVENVIEIMTNRPCRENCAYCRDKLDIHKGLKQFFGFDSFRTYDGEPLQENAVQAAVNGDSLLAIFPTGGGKSLTFQVPALMAGRNMHGLTVVISPLQSLMKDQVDNLEEKGIADAVAINGLLSPVERQEAIERVKNGKASILYISPESLRSRTIEKLLVSRNIARFVIDEAHCFSAWGQDFRVDYLFIGDFIKKLQELKSSHNSIPVSCFTATAKQKVIADICDYFRKTLNLDLKVFSTRAERKNLHYSVLFEETEDEKYNALRRIIYSRKCPTIVYVSRTRRTFKLAEKLSGDGIAALPFNGKMDSDQKVANQEAFMNNEVDVIVATSAFGMGVDKKDVHLVIHYDISDSLENYIQEAGRAGRDQVSKAECFVLFNNDDLDKHFILLNQTKLSISEIQQVWKAIKTMTQVRRTITCSALEIARQAGWDDSSGEIETRIRTAISALERAGYIKRGMNVPCVYATSIKVRNMTEGSAKIEVADILDDKEKLTAKRILKYLIGSRSRSEAGNDDAESRVDYIADNLGLEKEVVIDCINKMRQLDLLDDYQDMTANIKNDSGTSKTQLILEHAVKLEKFIADLVGDEGSSFNLKELNDKAHEAGIPRTDVKNIKKIVLFWTIKGYIEKSQYNYEKRTDIRFLYSKDLIYQKIEKRKEICKFIIEYLYEKGLRINSSSERLFIKFSLVGIYKEFINMPRLIPLDYQVVLDDISDGLLYLSKIGAINLEGGFLVSYNPMQIEKLVFDNKIQYKKDDYKDLDAFYKQRIQQIHIVGEYANLMVKDYDSAVKFVDDYFQMDFKKFISKYFKGKRALDINRNITPAKYSKLFDDLSDKQSEIISDENSQYIVVAAGPGSGKTRILVHKLAAILTLEDVKHEQLLMLTFSRAAATEFKKRIITLIGNAANFVEIKTFHSYCFDLLGKIGNLDGVKDVVKQATDLINNNDVEQGKILKNVLVIDEAQDMDKSEFDLVKALIKKNEDMKIIAVGDDDQNIYQFRGSNSKYFQSLITDYGAKKYEMVQNYRSKQSITEFAEKFVQKLNFRMKSEKCYSISDDKGIVQIIKHKGKNMEWAVVSQILYGKKEGSSCVLTSKNEEATRVLGLLKKHNVNAKLIQSNDDFNLSNLVEIRYFLEVLEKELTSPVIPECIYEKSFNLLKDKYSRSECFEICKNLLNDFKKTNKTMYKTDLDEFIKESKYEDFYDEERGVVYVSTIHKSKGREFDRVYMLLNDLNVDSEEEKRKIYVGLTRARDELYIHCNNDLFDDINFSNVIIDEQNYDEPDEILIQLSHRDVALGYFKNYQKTICRFMSGYSLLFESDYLYCILDNKKQIVAKLSHSFMSELEKLKLKGYKVIEAKTRFVVYWQGKDEDKEVRIVLPDIKLVKITQ